MQLVNLVIFSSIFMAYLERTEAQVTQMKLKKDERKKPEKSYVFKPSRIVILSQISSQ